MDRMRKIYTFLKEQEGKKIHRFAMQYQNQPSFQPGDIVWYLSARHGVGKPLKLTKSWTGPWLMEEKVLYRIKPNDGGNPFPAIVFHGTVEEVQSGHHYQIHA